MWMIIKDQANIFHFFICIQQQQKTIPIISCPPIADDPRLQRRPPAGGQFFSDHTDARIALFVLCVTTTTTKSTATNKDNNENKDSYDKNDKKHIIIWLVSRHDLKYSQKCDEKHKKHTLHSKSQQILTTTKTTLKFSSVSLCSSN